MNDDNDRAKTEAEAFLRARADPLKCHNDVRAYTYAEVLEVMEAFAAARAAALASGAAKEAQQLRAIAEDIVRNHDDQCVGNWTSAPWCSTEPTDHPLCHGCSKLADAIEKALLAAAAPPRPPAPPTPESDR